MVPRLSSLIFAVLFMTTPLRAELDLFMVPQRDAFSVMLDEPLLMCIRPDSPSRVTVWMEDTNQNNVLSGYQLIVRWTSSQRKNGTGSVEYLDDGGFFRCSAGPVFDACDPLDALACDDQPESCVLFSGSSMFVDDGLPEFVFASSKIFSPVYNETPPPFDPPHFGVFVQLLDHTTGLAVKGRRYLGEFLVQAAPNTTGDHVVQFVNTGQTPLTTLFAPFGFQFGQPDLHSLTVRVGFPVNSDPPHDAIDPRQPAELDGANASGWDHITLSFDRDTTTMSIDDFAIVSSHAQAPVVAGVMTEGNTVMLELDRPIPPGACTIIEYRPTCDHVRLGSLPGDVDNDGVTTLRDLDRLIGHFDHTMPELPLWRCDINRSGACEPQDILRHIDLLNGAGAYEAWLGVGLAACP